MKSLVLPLAISLLLGSCNSKKSDSSSNDTVVKPDVVSSGEQELPRNPITLSSFKNSEKLVVEPNTTIIIDKDAVSYSVLSLGNNSKMILSPNLDSCTISAQRCFIGSNVQISASGTMGSQGGPGASYGDDNDYGREGTSGGTGNTGGVGSNGRSLTLHLGLDKIGSMELIAAGGNGGAGGSGGKGQRGGNARRFVNSGGNGGAGGNGGQGGIGGDGGLIKVYYWLNQDATNVEGKFSINVPNGEGGVGGQPGPSGGGGSAVNSSPGKRSGGNPGPAGQHGGIGASGNNRGTFSLTQVRKPG